MATKSTSVKLTLKITSFILRLLMNIVFYVLVVILIINFSKQAYAFTYQLYGPDTYDIAPGRDIILQINKGESSMDIASKLQLNHAIENKYSFYLKTKLQNLTIMPGTYEINSAMTYSEILAIITDYSASIVKDEDTETDSGTPVEKDTEADSEKTTKTDSEKTTKTDSDTKEVTE